MSVALVDSVTFGSVLAPSRVVFGPHETNLGDGRQLSDRHVAYYERRARGGAGVIVTETASVTTNDWPYERAPLADACASGWRAIADACAPYATVVLAGIGHSGGQGSSAFSQEVMWAPSGVADSVSREPPAALDGDAIAGIVSAFAGAALLAVHCGLAGVEVDAGAWSLLRQFHSGLTNLRQDRYGHDRLAVTREVLRAVRSAVGSRGIVALRVSCDELAPWAGVTPEQAADHVGELAPLVDLLTVVRGGPFDTGAYRPDSHTPAGFNLDLCAAMRTAAGPVPIVAQGSIVDVDMAQAALSEGKCDLVEMTRALIADSDIVAKARAGRSETIRPCILCNQACRVRDNRNPIVSCVMDPSSGYETVEPALLPGDGYASGNNPSAPVLVVGGGPAGLEAARILASSGRRVRLVERLPRCGGAIRGAAAGLGRERIGLAARWLEERALEAGVAIETGVQLAASDVEDARADGWDVIVATGSRFVADRYANSGMAVFDPLDVLAGRTGLPDGPLAVVDSVGDWVGVNVALWLAAEHGRTVSLLSPDVVAGTLLSRGGQLGEINFRLERVGVRRLLRSKVRALEAGRVLVGDPWTDRQDTIEAAAVIDCGHRLAEERLYQSLREPRPVRVGDCVAPRGLLEAVLEARRAVASLRTRQLVGGPG